MTKKKVKVTPWKDPPFRLDLAQCGIPLTRQVCAGFERAIDSGYYAPGDKIPPVRHQMGIFNVSLSVAEDAMLLLMKTGRVYARPRIGTLVADRNAPARLGSIVFVYPQSEVSYYIKTFGATFAETVQNSGYTCTTVFVPVSASGKYDFSLLDRTLLHTPNLVVLLLPTKKIERHLSEKGVNFVVVGNHPCDLSGCRGWIRRIRNAATADFFAHCRAAGVKTVHQLYCEDAGLEVLADVPSDGLRIEAVQLGMVPATVTPGEMRRIGYEGFLRRYHSRQDLPDLLFAADDMMAAGIILALEHLHIRIPEDVKFVSWIHRGDEPPACCELTRIETEPVEHGRKTAEAVLDFLLGNPLALNIEIPPVYRIGQSFPSVAR